MSSRILLGSALIIGDEIRSLLLLLCVDNSIDTRIALHFYAAEPPTQTR